MVIVELFSLWFWTENYGKEVLFCEYCDIYFWNGFARLADPTHQSQIFHNPPMYVTNDRKQYGFLIGDPVWKAIQSPKWSKLFAEKIAERRSFERSLIFSASTN